MEAVIQQQFPAQAVTWLKENHSPGQLFNEYNWGGYLIWALPAYPVAVDGRTDLFGDQILQAYLDARAARPDWEDTLDAWQVDLALLSPEAPLNNALAKAGWRVLYQDKIAVVWGR